MNHINILSGILQSLAAQIPMIIVALVACIVTVLNWQQSPQASLFSLLGFGLTLLLCFAIPIAQSFIQGWIIPNGGSLANTRFIYMGLGIFWSVLRAASYALLLAAIYAGRSEPRTIAPAVPPSIPR